MSGYFVNHMFYLLLHYTRKMLQHHGASLSKQHIVLIYVMAHKPWLAAGFVTVCIQSGQLLWLHMHGLSLTSKSWTESLERNLHMALTRINFSHRAYHLWVVCHKLCLSAWFVDEITYNKPCKSWYSCFKLSHLCSGLLSCWRCIPAVTLHCRSQLS